jgi:LAO/AO transport system kinase
MAGDRRAVSKAITLLESTREDHQRQAEDLLQQLLPHAGNSLRIGVCGIPGAGKSTFIEALGMLAVEAGRRVAVLSVDPSSGVSGGSILADKTRMTRLAQSPHAYIRPTPSAGVLGGVAACTRDAMLVCEAAGHDVVIVETVGIGQSESSVATMTDLCILLQLPNTGDDLQAIKKGILELADLVVINKSDLDPAGAERAAAWIAGARHEYVACISARSGTGMADLWSRILALHDESKASGALDERRRRQRLQSMWEIVRAGLEHQLRASPPVAAALESVVSQVLDERLTPRAAAHALLDRFPEGPPRGGTTR